MALQVNTFRDPSGTSLSLDSRRIIGACDCSPIQQRIIRIFKEKTSITLPEIEVKRIYTKQSCLRNIDSRCTFKR